MPKIRYEEPISPGDVKELFSNAAPEQLQYIEELWQRYDPKFSLAEDGPGARLSANGKRIVFDRKTMLVYWLLSFAGWRVLACYSPAVVCALPGAKMSGILQLLLSLLPPSYPAGTTVEAVLKDDAGLLDEEGHFNSLIYTARQILHAEEVPEGLWPSQIPTMDTDRASLNRQDQATSDLAWISTAYAFCHELRHLMYAKDGDTPESRPVEELSCDRWARTFLTERISEYAQTFGEDESKVLAKRSMGGALGMFVLYESTERAGDAGSEAYPPFADRLQATLGNTPLESNHDFWLTYACVLVAILRRRTVRIDVSAANAKELCEALVEQVRETS